MAESLPLNTAQGPSRHPPQDENDSIDNSESTFVPADPEKSPESELPHLQRTVTDVPPDGGYGWVCVICNAFINGHTWGINSVSEARYELLPLSYDPVDVSFSSPTEYSSHTT